MRSPNVHVLHVITGIDRGGAENHLFDLVRHQRASGMAVTVAYLRGNGYWAAPLRALGVEVHALGLRCYGDPRPLIRLRRVISGAELDLVHAHLPPAELYCRFALLGISVERLPMIVTKHIDEPFCKLPGHLQIGRWVARRAARVIAISKAVRTYLTDFYLRLPPEQVVTIYYSLDAAPYLAVQPVEEGMGNLGGDYRGRDGGAAGGAEVARHADRRFRRIRLAVRCSGETCDRRLRPAGGRPARARA